MFLKILGGSCLVASRGCGPDS